MLKSGGRWGASAYKAQGMGTGKDLLNIKLRPSPVRDQTGQKEEDMGFRIQGPAFKPWPWRPTGRFEL